MAETDRESIARHDALSDLELHETSSGSRHVYSIDFITKKGEYIHLPHAYTCGLKGDMKANRLRGIRPCTGDGQPIGHVYPVQIDNILRYQGKTITL